MIRQVSFRTIVIITSVLAFAATIIFGVSYYTVSKLTFAGDYSIYGKNQSQLADEIREELIKRPDVAQITIKSTDNLNLAGFLIVRPHAKANMVLCHGYKSAKEFMYDMIDMFPDFNLLMFDFRAHGKSDGSIISIGCHEYKDVIAAVDFMRSQIPERLPLVLHGISMGAASILKATEVKPDLCDVLIVNSAFARLHTTMLKSFSEKSGLPYYPFYPVVKTLFQYYAHCNVHDMSPEESVQKIQQPIFFIHACVDKLIAPCDAISLFANAQNKDSRLWIGPRCRHATLHMYHTEIYKKKVMQFLKRTLPGIAKSLSSNARH